MPGGAREPNRRGWTDDERDSDGASLHRPFLAAGADRQPAERDRALPGARAAAARLRGGARAVLHRLSDLRRAQRREIQPRAGLPCADRRPARRQYPSRHRQARLVGDHGRSRQADRHQSLFRAVRQCHRRLHGLDRAELDQSRHRAPLRARLSRHHRARHGAGAGAAARSSRHSRRALACSAARWAACRCWNGPRPTRTACSRRCRSPAPRATPRRTSPSTRSAARR